MITIRDDSFYDSLVSLIRRKKSDVFEYVTGNYLPIDMEYGCLSCRFWILCTFKSDDDGNVSISSIDDIDVVYVIDESGNEYSVDIEEIWKRI